jgi:simple sugar transport system permease protein
MGFLRGGTPGGLTGLTTLLVVLVLAFAAAIPDFASIGTLQSIMFQMPELGLLSLAMMVPLLSGGLNLAIIATANQAALLMAWLMKTWLAAGAPPVVVIVGAMAAGLALCLVIGLVTGALVAYTGVHPILVTLGMRSLVEGISIYLTRGTIISGLPGDYAAAGNALIGGVPVPFLVLIASGVLVAVLLRRTAFGISVFMIGSNIEATRYSAVNVRRVLVGVYVASSVLCFVAACLMLARFNSASAEYAQSYLLITILAAVLGGVDPFGGFGKVAGLMLSLAVLQVLASGSNLLGFSDYLKLAIWGLVLIGVMASQTVARAWQARRHR